VDRIYAFAEIVLRLLNGFVVLAIAIALEHHHIFDGGLHDGLGLAELLHCELTFCLGDF
jgi:hypothetical protein